MGRFFSCAALVAAIGVLAGVDRVHASAQAPPGESPVPAQEPAVGTDQLVKVLTGDYFYEPNQLVIRPGQVTIELTNEGPRRHTLNVRDLDDQSDLAQSPRIVAGDTISMTFTIAAEGTYAIYCSEPGHLDQGHLGSLVALAPAAEATAQPAPTRTAPAATQGRRDLSPTLIALWLHVPFITAWIGLVMLDVFVLLVPGLARGQRARMVAWSRPFAILAIVVIMVTGIWQTVDNPFLEVKSYAELTRLRETTTYGLALFWKHGFVLATFGLTILARFLLAPRLAAMEGRGETNAAADRIQQALLWTSVANLGACLGALLLATRMVWELH